MAETKEGQQPKLYVFTRLNPDAFTLTMNARVARLVRAALRGHGPVGDQYDNNVLFLLGLDMEKEL